MSSIMKIILGFIFVNLISDINGFELQRAREEPTNYGAWYQMPQSPSAYPPSGYERAPPSTYPVYPRPYSRSPDYYPESSVTNNMIPPPRKYYPSHSISSSQDPNQELINAVKEVIKTFKKSLDRSGVHEDVKHMGHQIENTWNDLKRGMQKSWLAFRQSAENAVLTPISTSTSNPPLVYIDPYIITREQQQKNVDDQNREKYTSSLMTNSLTKLLRNIVNEQHGIDSGKLDQWIQQAHHMLADSVTEADASKILAATETLRQQQQIDPNDYKKVQNPRFNGIIQQ